MECVMWLIMAMVATFVDSKIISKTSFCMLIAVLTTATCIASTEAFSQDKLLEDQSLHWTQNMGNFVTADSDSENHKSLFPLDTSDYIGIIAAVIGLMMAAGGGIGGGGILVPVYVLIMNFDAKMAVPLSNATILGGSIANMILNSKKRHPKKDTPLINWDLILIMEPPIIGGAIIGSILSKMLPGVVIVTCLVVLLSATSYRFIRTGIRLYKKESLASKKEHIKITEFDPLIKSGSLRDGHDGTKINEAASTIDSEMSLNNEFGAFSKNDNSEELKDILEQERCTPILKVACLTGFFLISLGLNFCQLIFTCGTTAYILLYVAIFAWVILASIVFRRQLVKEWEKKKMVSYPFMEGDVQWTPKNAILYPSLCSFAGLFAGLFGIGGGIIKGPLMLELGVIPQVVSATSACMILYTSFTATSSYLALGLLTLDYAAILMIVGFFATCIGQLIISHFVKKYNRASLIVLSIGSVVALSAILLGWESISSIISRSNLESTSFCNSDTA